MEVRMAEIPNLFELAGNGLPVDHGQLGPCVGDDFDSTQTATVIVDLGPCVGDDAGDPAAAMIKFDLGPCVGDDFDDSIDVPVN